MNKISFTFQIYFLITIVFIFVIMSIGAIFSESRIFDEGLHVDAGYAFLTRQDFAKEPFNPPLARELVALPSLFYPSTLTDPIYFWQRIVVVVISCIFLIILYSIVQRLMGVLSAMFATVLYVFNPEIVSHSHYAVTDLILSFFIFLSILLYVSWKERFSLFRLIILGMCIGFALSAKVSAIPFLCISFILLFFIEVVTKQSLRFAFQKKFLLSICIVLLSSAISLWATYFFTQESIMGEGFIPRNHIVKAITNIPGTGYVLSQPIPLGGYLRTVKQVILYNYSDIYSKPAFLLGIVAPQGHWYFYPIAFLLKTPLPLLIFIFLSIYCIKQFSYKVLLLPVFAIGVSAMLSTLNLGIRYALPIYPILFVYLSQITHPTIRFPYKYPVIIILLAWYIAGTLSVYPHTLSFMNELVGSQMHRHHVLLDSNYDWGQGLVALRNYQQSHKSEKIQLAYFGMVDPEMYDIVYERIGGISHGDKKKSQEIKTLPGYTTAISASCYYFCEYYKDSRFKNKEPNKIIGGSILLFTW